MTVEIFKAFYDIQGSKIHFRCPEGEYEGIVKYATPHILTIEHVYMLPGRAYVDSLNFNYNEILSHTVIESPKNLKPFEYLKTIFSGKCVKNTCIDDLFNYELDDLSDEDESKDEEEVEKEFVLKLPSYLEKALPNKTMILHSIGNMFRQAITHILQESSIGVSFAGAKISRFGKISWISVSTKEYVFLFDIESLENKAFDQGLRKVFQSKCIEKVIHDCRETSDCLTHVYATNLVNVFDTQVADYIVMKQRYKDIYDFDYVTSLDCCLINHLDIPQTYLGNRKKKFSYEDEVAFFMARPIDNEYQRILIKNSIYLTLLKEKLAKLMLEPFYKSVDIYLKVLANASEPELLLDLSVPNMMPPAVLMQGLKTVRFQETSEKPLVPLICKFQDPVSGKIIDSYKSSKSNKQSMSDKEREREIDVDKSLASSVKDSNNKENKMRLPNSFQETSEKPLVPLICKFQDPVSGKVIDSYKSSKSNKQSASDKERDRKIDVDKSLVSSVKDSNNKEKKMRLPESSFTSSGDIKTRLDFNSEKNSIVIKEMSVRKAGRHVDRVYHRMVNSHCSNSQMPYNIIDVKPNDFVSKFVQKKSLSAECHDDKNIHPSQQNGYSHPKYKSEFQNMSVANLTNSSKNDALSDMSDIWSKLRAEFESCPSEKSSDLKNVRFVPAGMY